MRLLTVEIGLSLNQVIDNIQLAAAIPDVTFPRNFSLDASFENLELIGRLVPIPIGPRAMFWDEAETAIRAYIELQWALTSFAAIPLSFENEFNPNSDRYMLVNIEGSFSDKSIFGPEGSRISQEYGMVYYHSFGKEGVGKLATLSPCVAMANLLELRVLQETIYLDGANPPSPAQTADLLVPDGQPSGQYYRCSGSVPFLLLGAR